MQLFSLKVMRIFPHDLLSTVDISANICTCKRTLTEAMLVWKYSIEMNSSI